MDLALSIRKSSSAFDGEALTASHLRIQIAADHRF